MKLLFVVFISVSLFLQAQEVDTSDILFLKIQELEGEIASLRSEIESQSYLIEKILEEDSERIIESSKTEKGTTSNENNFRFDGINDIQSIEEVYNQAISELNKKNFQAAKKSFIYLTDNFNDEEKIPLSLFWLGEIFLLESNLLESKNFFQMLAANHPDHWRTPLAYKKIGDILVKNGETDAAKIKYQFVVQTFPGNTASSLALQLLENME